MPAMLDGAWGIENGCATGAYVDVAIYFQYNNHHILCKILYFTETASKDSTYLRIAVHCVWILVATRCSRVDISHHGTSASWYHRRCQSLLQLLLLLSIFGSSVLEPHLEATINYIHINTFIINCCIHFYFNYCMICTICCRIKGINLVLFSIHVVICIINRVMIFFTVFNICRQ